MSMKTSLLFILATLFVSCGDSGTSTSNRSEDAVYSSISQGSSSIRYSASLSSSYTLAHSSELVVSSSSVGVSLVSSSIIASSVSFFNPAISYGSITDIRDGQTYKTIAIGTQTWLAENLNYSGDNGAGARAYTKGACYGVGGFDTTQHQDSLTCSNGYGRLYNWTDAMNIKETYSYNRAGQVITTPHRGLCPADWHVPTEEAWGTLVSFLCTDNSLACEKEGNYVKSVLIGNGKWNNPAENAQDPYGFSGLPAGYRRFYDSRWSGRDEIMSLWSATEHDKDKYEALVFGAFQWNLLSRSEYDKGYAFPLRCVMDKTNIISSSSSKGGTSVVIPSSSAGGTSIITPSSNSNTGSVIWQGKTYRTTNIGGKMWFAENLDYGTQVSASSGQVNSGAVEKSCYDDSAANCTIFGGLYTWAEAMALPSSCNTTSCVGSMNTPHQGICPDGWHIPTRADFAELLQEVGVASIAGKYLKSETGWPSGNNGTDDYVFTALPSGLYSSLFLWNTSWIGIWEADEDPSNSSKAYEFSLGLSDASSVSAYYKSTQISIRCQKN